jgi:hypothetical protein
MILFSALRLNLGDKKFKDDQEMGNCVTMADNTGRGLLSTGNGVVNGSVGTANMWKCSGLSVQLELNYFR